MSTAKAFGIAGSLALMAMDAASLFGQPRGPFSRLGRAVSVGWTCSQAGRLVGDAIGLYIGATEVKDEEAFIPTAVVSSLGRVAGGTLGFVVSLTYDTLHRDPV